MYTNKYAKCMSIKKILLNELENTNMSSICDEKLVSIIMPAYNCEKFIGSSIESVLKQEYKNWELIIVDDCSTDGTRDKINEYKDERVIHTSLEKNSGAAIARNKAISMAGGVYIAFLDSDDIWYTTKLKKQISFMEDNNYSFTATQYNKIDENGDSLNRIISVSKKQQYWDLLKKSPGNSTVIYDAVKLGKFNIPNLKKRNDYVLWLQIIKKANYLYGVEETLASHRIRRSSISRNKFSLVKYHWEIYRNIEKLNIWKSCYLIMYWIIVTIFKLR